MRVSSFSGRQRRSRLRATHARLESRRSPTPISVSERRLTQRLRLAISQTGEKIISTSSRTSRSLPPATD